MFRKIPSKGRDTTVIPELRNEFSTQAEAFESVAKTFMERHAKLVFCAMILLILASFILSFFVFKSESTNQGQGIKSELNAIPTEIGGEFSALQKLSSRALKIAELETEIERIISQKSISEEDSAYLEKAIEQLQYFTKQPKENED